MTFGSHPGFPGAPHPLLKGRGLWVFNDGEFKQGDAVDLRSFGIASKAGDTGAIGKFGLGMKSVFHLCEALFYVVARDGKVLHREGLTPWKQEGHWPHQDWDRTLSDDWNCLTALGQGLAGKRDCTWFLLWLPLRMRAHLKTPSGEKSGAIINYFPGDNPSGELAFLNDLTLAHDIAEMLPLLRHLERVEHKGKHNPFVLKLTSTPRLMGDPPRTEANGQVLREDGEPPLVFSGRRLASPDADGRFARMKAREEWPRIRSRDDLGRERLARDKTSPEAAVLFCSGLGSATRSRLHWAVFLPVEDGGEDLKAGRGERGHSLVLHGQFFLDAGRKTVHGLELLHQIPEHLGDASIDEGSLRTMWNQRLAQEVVLPLVLPALERYAEQQGLSDDECSALTKALADSRWFETFRTHVCRDAFWTRTLEPGTKPRWRLIKGERRPRLRPLPKPPRSAPERPWEVFPKLTACETVPYDVDAPCLVADGTRQWQKEELAILLSEVNGLFVEARATDYLAEFLDSCAGPCRSTENLQRQLLDMLRNGLRAAGLDARRQVTAKARRLVGFLDPKRRLELPAELPEAVLKKLWEIEAPVLLVPKGLEPGPSSAARPDEEALAAWLRVLDRALESNGKRQTQQPILEAVQGLLKTLPTGDRGRFLHKNQSLRIIGVRDVRNGVEKPVSLEYLENGQKAGTLFGFADGLRGAELGIARVLARALPDADICLVRARTWRELLSDDGSQGQVPRIPAANDGRACLAAVGRLGTGRLGNLPERRALLERANDPGTDEDARRGLRLLLHGSLDHRTDDTARLWIGRHDQHRVWNQLWAAMHEGEQWSSVSEELANTIPRNRWSLANIAEIDARTLLDELRTSGQGIKAPERFTNEERDEILSRIEHEDLWRPLPLHTTSAGESVSGAGERVYLASREERGEDPLSREATLIAPSPNRLVADQQKRWLHPLDDRARIEIALGTAEPVRYWRSVMDALAILDEDAIDADLRAGLRSTAWLPPTRAQHGAPANPEPVKPEDVIDLTDSLGDEAHRLVVEHRVAHGPCFAVPGEMEVAVGDHQAWLRLRQLGFSSGTEGLDRLGLLLEDLPAYRIGKWPRQPQPDELALLARCDRLPGWRLLEMASVEPFDLETAWARLEPALSRSIAAGRLATVSDWLSGTRDQWTLRKSLHDAHLRQLAGHGQAARDHVPRLRFASDDGQWREAAELCTDAHGVARDRLLDREQADILGDLVCRAGTDATGERAGGLGDLPDPAFRTNRQDTAETLRDYFQSWNSNLVPASMIGVVLALLGPALRDLAKAYLKPHSFEWLVGKLPWSDPGRTRERREWMGETTVAQALDRIQSDVHVQTGGEVKVLNLLGQSMRVALEQDPHTLLAGALSWQGGYGVMIPLRRIQTGGLQPERLRDLLRATAERLYSDLYNQGGEDFSALWQELDQSDQLEIDIARHLILDHIPFYLRQLSVKCEGIEEQLSICDGLRRRVAEAEEDKQSAEPARTKLRGALDELANRIDGREDEQQAVVHAVKSKLEQYQYDPSSIPFEIFQNADDAAVELGRLHAHPSEGCEVPTAAHRFVVEERVGGVGFLHWGRTINACGPVGYDGERRGYDRDLEKMLILSSSDKPGDEGVTGKFGLGFKSVLLACEQPRILSGRLAIRVVAGILPQPWEDVREARQRLIELGTDPLLPGTLIDLPGVQGKLRVQVLERFRPLAGILCVFGRAVRSITHVASGEWQPIADGLFERAPHVATEESNWCWQPSEISQGVEVGSLDLRGDWGDRTTAICVRTDTDNGSLLVALGPKGFRPLPDTVPALWVTAPTRESTAVGFAINGSFDLDAGRGRLAGNTASNLEKAKRIGREAGDALGGLLERSREDWGSVRADLGLAADVGALDLWESIWLGLTKGCLRRTANDRADLVREVTLGALARLCDRPCPVPNGLQGPLRGFTDAKAIRYELSEVLLREEVSAALGVWNRFTARYPGPSFVSREIGDIVRRAKLGSPQTLGLSALVGLLDRSRTEPADAEVLGRLLLMTEEAADWKSDDLRERLSKLLFRSEADEWVEARTLLARRGTGLDPDEPRRHALAPPASRLHADYYIKTDGEWPAVAFFELCRRRMDAPVEQLTQWVLDAEAAEAKSAALTYLADGELGERVADQVRERGWLRSVLYDDGLLGSLTTEQQQKLRRRLASSAHIERAIVNFASGWESDERIPPHVDLPTALERLHEWWSSERSQFAREYRNRLYPLPPNLKPDPETGRVDLDPSSWFLLLALGSFQGMGRTREEQHRGFIQHCQERGWWDVFTTCDPKREPEKWMNIIEEYAEEQHDDEEWAQWLAQFPKLYRLRRWLDDYVALFRSMDRFQESFALDTILAPRSNPKFQGGGIEAPPLTRTLKLGSHLVVRELLHYRVLRSPLAVPHAYAPISRVQEFFRAFGVPVDTSENIHQLLKDHLGEDEATFNGGYDIPLRLISADDSLCHELLSR